VRYKQNPIRTTVVFYGRRSFERKTVQADAKKRHQSGRYLSCERSLCETVKNHAEKPGLNYESPALTAELQAHLPMKNGVSCRTQKSLIDFMLTFNSPGAPCVSITLPASS
jgi:hypothetical protein